MYSGLKKFVLPVATGEKVRMVAEKKHLHFYKM